MKNFLIKIKKAGKKIIVVIVATATIIGGGISAFDGGITETEVI